MIMIEKTGYEGFENVKLLIPCFYSWTIKMFCRVQGGGGGVKLKPTYFYNYYYNWWLFFFFFFFVFFFIFFIF